MIDIICITESRDERILHLGNVPLDHAIEAVRYLKRCNPSKQFILKPPANLTTFLSLTEAPE